MTTMLQAGEANSAVQATDLLDLVMRLADLLEHETALLRSGKVQDIAPLQVEKLRLTVLYDKTGKALIAAGAKLETLPAPLRAQLVAASTRLSQIVAENERALRVGRAAARQLLDVIVNSVRMREKPLLRYSAKPGKPCHVPVRAFAVDRRL